MPIPTASRTSGELISSVIVEFVNLPDYYFTKKQWEGVGGYRGFLSSHQMSITEIKKVHKILLNPEDFPTEEWQP